MNKIEKRVREMLRTVYGREPSAAEIADAVRGYRDQTRWDATLETSLSEEQYQAALEAELKDVLDALDGKSKKQ